MGRKQIIFIAVLIVLMALLPAFIENDSLTNILILVMLYIILASSWNVLGGYTGQTNLGHAAFFGLGALATRTLWLAGWNIFPSLLVGGAVAVVFSLIIGIPAFKLHGVYFAIGTLALAQILNITVGNIFPMNSALSVEYLGTYDLAPRYYLFLGLAVLTVATTYFLVNSKLGLGLMAVREEEDAAESLGISALKHKLLALGISAFFAGLAGGAYAYYQASYYFSFPFSPEWTFDSMIMAYIGGTGTIFGPVFGAVFYVILKQLLILKLGELHLIIFGILFILVVLFLPGGFVEAWKKARLWLSRRSGKPRLQPPAEQPTS
jgi:branched-chain amino acid transport system permease protein